MRVSKPRPLFLESDTLLSELQSGAQKFEFTDSIVKLMCLKNPMFDLNMLDCSWMLRWLALAHVGHRALYRDYK